MKRTIPVPSGEAHFRFSVELGDERLTFRLDWLTRWGYYHVTVLRGGETLVAGRALHPDVDLLDGLRLSVGKVYLSDPPATPANLGQTNRVVHEP